MDRISPAVTSVRRYTVTVLKSTYQIINDYWSNVEDTKIQKYPLQWSGNDPITFNDVVIWEQVYHQPGNIGIYIAHSPKEEFYAVVYDLFSKEDAGVKTFYGNTAVADIMNLSEKLGISLKETWLQV